MSLINKLLNKNIKEDLYFEKYENLGNIFSKYKNYLNFSKKTEKIEIENIENINEYKIIQINISNKLYDLISNMYLYIEFVNNNIEYTINDLIDYIELYIGDKTIEKIDGDIIDIYFNIYLNENNKKVYENIYKIDNNSRRIYIPILFYFMLENKNLIPLYLLHFEEMSLYIKFKNKENLIVKDNQIYLLINYIKLDNKYINTIKYQSDVELLNSITTNEFNFQRMELIKTDDLECTIDGIEKNNIFNIKLSKFITHIILKIENVITESIELKVNTSLLKYTSKELEFLTFLNTNFNLNKKDNLYLLNFGIIKEKLSGLVNFNLINNLTLELKVINTDNINLNFSEINGSLKLTRANATPIIGPNPIKLSRNIVYNIIYTDTNMDIVVVKEDKNTHYEEFDNVNKTFIIRETTPRIYFKDEKNKNTREISIDVGNLNEGDFKYFAGKLKLYTMEYKKYDIFNGKLLGIGDNKENYLIIKLEKILKLIENIELGSENYKKVVNESYNMFKELKIKYKTLIDDNNKIEEYLDELKNNNIENKKILISDIKSLIEKLKKMKSKLKKNIVEHDNYLIIELEKILKNIERGTDENLVNENYDIFKKLKIRYKTLIDGDDIIERLLDELRNNNIENKEKLIDNIRKLIIELKDKKANKKKIL